MDFIAKPDGNSYFSWYNEIGRSQNCLLGWSGISGIGKTVAVNASVDEFHNVTNATVIYLTEKKGNMFDNAFCFFEPVAPYHLKQLENDGIQPYTRPIKLYHPFTFNLPHKKSLPPINFYTYSLKSLNESALSILLSTKVDSQQVLFSNDTLALCTRENDIYDYLFNLAIAKYNPISTGFHLPIQSEPRKNIIKAIENRLNILISDFFLQPHNHPNNIDFAKILNDNKHFHFFSYGWLSDQRTKIFSIYQNLQMIDEALSNDKVNKRVIIVLEEIKALLPSTELSIYQDVLLKLVIDLLNRIRTKASIILTTQSFFDTSTKLMNSTNLNILMKLPPLDIRRLTKDYQFKQDELETLYSLKVGEFVVWAKAEDEFSKISDKCRVFLPPFRISEEGETFFSVFQATHPELMQDYQILYQEMKAKQLAMEEKNKQRFKEFIQKQKEAKQKKEQAQKQKQEESQKIQELKTKLKSKTDETQEKLIKDILLLHQQGKSLREIAVEVGLKSASTVDKYLKRGLKSTPPNPSG